MVVKNKIEQYIKNISGNIFTCWYNKDIVTRASDFLTDINEILFNRPLINLQRTISFTNSYRIDETQEVKYEHHISNSLNDFPFGINTTVGPIIIMSLWRIVIEIDFACKNKITEYKLILNDIAYMHFDLFSHNCAQSLLLYHDLLDEKLNKIISNWKKDENLWDLCYIWKGYSHFKSAVVANPLSADMQYETGYSSYTTKEQRPFHAIDVDVIHVVNPGKENKVRYFYPYREKADEYKQLFSIFNTYLRQTLKINSQFELPTSQLSRENVYNLHLQLTPSRQYISPDIWDHIVPYLTCYDLVRLRSTCRYYYSLFPDESHFMRKTRISILNYSATPRKVCIRIGSKPQSIRLRRLIDGTVVATTYATDEGLLPGLFPIPRREIYNVSTGKFLKKIDCSDDDKYFLSDTAAIRQLPGGDVAISDGGKLCIVEPDTLLIINEIDIGWSPVEVMPNGDITYGSYGSVIILRFPSIEYRDTMENQNSAVRDNSTEFGSSCNAAPSTAASTSSYDVSYFPNAIDTLK